MHALCEQALVVERHSVGCLVLDAVPKRLEFRAVEHGLARTNRATLVGVLDLQAPGKLEQHLGDLEANSRLFLDYLALMVPSRLLVETRRT